MIIDSHMHLPVNYQNFALKKKALLREMRNNGVDRGIIIADSELESVIGSVRECMELFNGDSVIKVVAGISPFISFDNQLNYCRGLLRNGDIIGLKLYTGHENFYCTDSVLFPVYDLASEFHVPVLFHTGWDKPHYAAPEKIRKLAKIRNDTVFVYCHCNYPEIDRCFEVLGDCENVYFDTSSIADDPEKLPQIRNSLEKAIKLMPERFLFGSDFGSCSQEAHLSFAESLGISNEHRELFMHYNSEYVYRL
ncbi:amidohydrolase family protein [Ruminococcus sp.]|uniref:amidohydrolase family protein n=1 Tax=Ruminococcus sp. TaxID=41978 RepID=UPI0025CC736F|nr:amidohydrolase family protein [Ruminococcus sp.]